MLGPTYTCKSSCSALLTTKRNRTHLSRTPYLDTARLQHHLYTSRISVPKKSINNINIAEQTCLQCASQPTTLGTAKRTGKKSSGKPIARYINPLLRKVQFDVPIIDGGYLPKVNIRGKLAFYEVFVIHSHFVQLHRSFQ